MSEEQKARKIAIVGAAPSSRDLAPYDDPTWEIWGCSPSMFDKIKRVDAWFEIHSLYDLTNPGAKAWAPRYLEWLRGRNHVVYMQDGAPDVCPAAHRFPLPEIKEAFGREAMLLTSSISLMTAFAIYSGATEIGIWGVDMTAGGEYDYERPGCIYWIEQARKRSIPVYIPPESDLDAPVPVYGFGDASAMAIKLKVHRKELRDRIEVLNVERAQLMNRVQNIDIEKAHLAGAHDQSIWMARTFVAWSGPDA